MPGLDQRAGLQRPDRRPGGGRLQTHLSREGLRAKSDRVELGKLLKVLTPGDVVIVARLDRLARSTLDLLAILRRVTEAGAKFRSLKDPWADTTTPHGELMVTILAGLATFERHLIKARTEDGRKRAKERGVRFGRPPKLTTFQRQEAMERLHNGESQANVARAYNINPAAICRLRRSELGIE